MAQYTRRRTSPALALGVAAIAAAACGGGADRTQNALSQDSALARDLSLAQGADSARQPQLQDVPATTPPVAPPVTAPMTPAPEAAPGAAPAPAPAPARRTEPRAEREPAPSSARRRTTTPPPRPSTTTAERDAASAAAAERGARAGRAAAEGGGTGTIPSGTTLALASNRRICTNTSAVGDRFTASLSSAVTGTNGATIPAGATATVEVTELDRSENVNDKIKMGFRVVSVSYGGRTYAVDATTEGADVTRVRNQPAAKDRQKVIGGAVAGAIAGRIIGGRGAKGAIIGAATGAAAGAGVAAATANYEGCLNEGAGLRARLTDAVQVRLTAARAAGAPAGI